MINAEHMLLDEISFKIMTELCQDGRYSNAKLAQKLGINVSTVSKRTRSMLQNGVIVIRAIPNPVKMGYVSNAFIGLSIDPRKIEEIRKQLMENPHVNLMVNCFGRFDILLLVYLRKREMLHDFLREDLPRIKGINQIETFFISEAKKWYDGTFEDNKNGEEITLDETDDKLIRELMRNGRANFADLAGNLGVSISTVSKRIDSLIKDDILKIIAIPNPSKLGYSVDAYVTVRCELDKLNSICNRLSSFIEIYLVMTLMNGYDILFGIHALNPDSLYQFLQTNITPIDGILHTETFIRGNYLYLSPDALFPPVKKS